MVELKNSQVGGFRAVEETLSSFDGGEEGQVMRFAPDRFRFFDESKVLAQPISRGAGLSYCAASFKNGGQSVSHSSFDRIIDFDSASGEVEVEPGVNLGALYRFLAKHKRHLACHPGHSAISIGGCLAADVHGKNHVRDGTFVRQVVEQEIFHPSHGSLKLSRQKNPELFELTCGGFGLTGHIQKVRLRTQPLKSNIVETATSAFNDFSSTIEALVAVQDNCDYA